MTRIYAEFEELGIELRTEWLLERYSEFRKLTKVLLTQVLQSSLAPASAAMSSRDGQIDWFDTILTLNNLVVNFNLALAP